MGKDAIDFIVLVDATDSFEYVELDAEDRLVDDYIVIHGYGSTDVAVVAYSFRSLPNRKSIFGGLFAK